MTKMLCEVQFATRMHNKGINLRHMGVVRQKATDKDLRSFILANAIARVLKNMLRAKLRSILRTYQVSFSHSLALSLTPPTTKVSDVACKRLIADFFNETLFPKDVKTISTCGIPIHRPEDKVVGCFVISLPPTTATQI